MARAIIKKEKFIEKKLNVSTSMGHYINCKQRYVYNQNHKGNIFKIEMETKVNDGIG